MSTQTCGHVQGLCSFSHREIDIYTLTWLDVYVHIHTDVDINSPAIESMEIDIKLNIYICKYNPMIIWKLAMFRVYVHFLTCHRDWYDWYSSFVCLVWIWQGTYVDSMDADNDMKLTKLVWYNYPLLGMAGVADGLLLCEHINDKW